MSLDFTPKPPFALTSYCIALLSSIGLFSNIGHQYPSRETGIGQYHIRESFCSSYMSPADVHSSSNYPKMTSLALLPTELLLQIIDHLGPSSSTSLGLTCKTLYTAHWSVWGKVPLTNMICGGGLPMCDCRLLEPSNGNSWTNVWERRHYTLCYSRVVLPLLIEEWMGPSYVLERNKFVRWIGPGHTRVVPYVEAVKSPVSWWSKKWLGSWKGRRSPSIREERLILMSPSDSIQYRVLHWIQTHL